MRVFLLGGAGLQGQYFAGRAAKNPAITEITIAGRNAEKAKKAALAIGEKANSRIADATDETQLTRLIRDYDVFVNTSGPDYLVQPHTVRAAIEAGVHYCDVSCDGPATEKVLKLDSKAKAAGVTAIIGIGWGPGLDNLMMAHAARQLDKADSVHSCMAITFSDLAGGDTDKIASEMRESGPYSASWETFMRLFSGPCRIFRNGKRVTVDPFESGVVMPNPKGGTIKLYPGCGPQPITVPHSVKGLKESSVLISFVPFELNELVRRISSRITLGEIDTREAAIAFIEAAGAERGQWAPVTEKFPEDFWITATGVKDGRRIRYTLIPTSGWLSTTGPLYCAAKKILDGELKERGVLPPEVCLDPIPFMEEVASSEPGWTKEKKLFDEKLERLE